jgi:hypothetical protein
MTMLVGHHGMTMLVGHHGMDESSINNPNARIFSVLTNQHGCLSGRQQFMNIPNVISESRFHCRRYPQCLVHAAEIVPREVQRQHCVELLPFFRECIGQPGESHQRRLERVREFVYQHRVGHFQVECRILDGDRVMGVGVVEFEVLFKGRFSDVGLPGATPA